MLKVEFGRSRSLALLFALAHGFAILLLPWSGLPVWAGWVLGVGVVLSGLHAITLYAWQLRKTSIAGIELTDDCRLRVRNLAGQWLDAEIHPSSFVTPYLAVLNYCVEGRRVLSHLLIVPDRVDADGFRRLRVWLRWRCSGQGLEEKTVA